MMPKNLRYDNRNACCVPYDSPPPGLLAQLHRLVTEERPGACVGCGFEHNCRRDGCAVLRKISHIVATIRGALDKINAEKAAQRPLDEAFALRGDKIRRDVHKHGLTGRKK